MDVLSELLNSNRLNARVFLHANFCGNWAVDTSGTHQATFHVIARGACWLHMPNVSDPLPLRAGDLVVFPHDAHHLIADSPSLPGPEVPRNQPANDDNGSLSSSLICGYFEFAPNKWNPLLDALPDTVLIRSEDAAATGRMESLINLMIYETDTAHKGSDVVIDRLSDVLFIHVVRNYIRQARPDTGYIAALADPKVSRALGQFHRQPGKSWSVERLAQEAGMSRSTFAERFTQITAQTPMQYVTRWRMQLAQDLLISSGQSTGQIAAQCGYLSAAAFSKVFKKYFGCGPGAIRRGQ